MPGSNYTVASAATLLGAKPPKRSTPPEDMYFARTQRTDNANREQSALRRTENARTVRFTPSTIHPEDNDKVDDQEVQQSNSPGKADSAIDIPALGSQTSVAVLQPSAASKAGLVPHQTSPSVHQWRIAQTERPQLDTSIVTLGGLSRSTSTCSKRSKKPDTPDFYFSPKNLRASTTSLSSLLASPPLETGNEADSSLVLSPGQVDRLTIALAEAPFLQHHVRRQWYDARPEASPARSGNTTPTQPSFPPTTLDPHPERSIPHALALTDPNVAGAPIRFLSQHFPTRGNTLQVGACTFLNMPYGASTSSSLRIERGGGGAASKIILQSNHGITSRRQAPKRAYALIAELDITARVRDAALAEFAAHTAASPPTPPATADAEGSIDWCALGNEPSLAPALSAAPLASPTLTPETAALLTHLSALQAAQSDILLLRIRAHHPDNSPQRVSVPWQSQALTRRIGWRRSVHEAVLGAAEAGLGGGEGFEGRIGRGGRGGQQQQQQQRVWFEPLRESGGSGGGGGERVAVWACFLL